MSVLAEAAAVTEVAVAEGGALRFELESWRALGFRAGVTGRAGNFDLGLFGDGRAGEVMGNWLAFAASQRPDFHSVVIARQVHGCGIRHHAEVGTGWMLEDALDGHLTARRGLLLAVTIADCIPVYLAHPASATVGLLHAGWKGTAAGILEAGIRQMVSVAGCRASDIVMHCGVGICGMCYEVGPEVIRGVTGAVVKGPTLLDLRAALADRAVRLGVRDVSVSTWCSSHHGDLFFSHRRSGGGDGRMVAYLGAPGGTVSVR